MDGPPAADLRHPRARRRALGREGDRHRQRPRQLHPALPGPVGLEPLLEGAATPGWPRAASKVFEGLPTAGAALPALRLGRVRAVHGHARSRPRRSSTIREVWWDIRPHPDFGTVELRICDGMPTMGEVAAVAAISQCLVDRLDTLIDRGYTLPVPAELGHPREQVAGRPLRARRRDHHRRPGPAPAGPRGDRGARRRAGAGRPRGSAAATSCATRSRIMERGPSYIRQREVIAAGGAMTDVVDSLVEELRTDRLTPTPKPAIP